MKYDILPKGFKVKSGAVSFTSLPPATKKLAEFLDSAPFRELYTTKDLAARIGYRLETTRDAGNHPAGADYKVTAKGVSLLWGSKKTIREFKRLQKAQR